jgi:hypothetical protein
MPDACPSGGSRATIPVGGGIEVENAIIPGAHSADICCSMFATFFPANHPIGEMMDHLQKTTHFGAGGRPRGYQMTSAVLEEPVWDNAFLSGLRNRLAKKGVHVLTVLPGFVATRMTAGMDLPARLTAQPAEVAEALFKGVAARKDVIYVKPAWRLIMSVIRVIPERIFKGMSI